MINKSLIAPKKITVHKLHASRALLINIKWL